MQSFLGKLLACLFLSLGMASMLAAAEYKLKDGTVYQGEIRSLAQRGVIIRYQTTDGDTKFTPNIAWEKFAPETLNEFYKDEKARQYVELLIVMPKDSTVIEDSLAAVERPKKPPLEIKPSGSPGLISVTKGFLGTLFSTGIGKYFFLVFYALNLYGAYEVAVFRRWNRAVVMVSAAIIPVLPTIVFLSMPTRVQAKGYGDEEEGQPGDSTEHPPSTSHHGETHDSHGHTHDEGHEEHGHGHEVEEASPVAHTPPPIPATQVFKRGEVSINRRYIETKFAGFFRMVPSEADKDLYLVMKTARGEFLGKRVSKITTTDITLQLALEGGGSEETFPLNDIFEIQIRHKDAPAQ